MKNYINSRSLNTVGLIFGILGVIIVFIWGAPQPDFTTGVSLGLPDGTVIDQKTQKTVADRNKEVLDMKKVYSYRSRFGLFLIMIGFGFQLCAVWVPFSLGTNKTDDKLADHPSQFPSQETTDESGNDDT